MTAQNPDNARSVTKYTGQNYTFTAAYRRSRDPTPSDLRDPLNQGYYPFTSLWINKTNQNLWSLVDITNNVATWILLGGSTHPQIQFLGGAGTVGFPVDPTAAGKVTLESVGGTITITGTPNTINFDVTGGATSVMQLGVDAAIAPGTNPVLPSAGQIDIHGVVATAGTTPIKTISRAANEFNIEVQKSQATAIATATANGISHFNSAQFTVSPDAFVSLIGGPSPPIIKFDVDANTPPGTDPVIADALGNVTITGGQINSGIIATNAIRTNSLAANTYTIEIQRSATSAASNVNLNGISHYRNTQFTIDTDGFVSLVGGTGPAASKFIMQTGTSPVVPDALGQVTFNGAAVAQNGNPVRTDGTGANTMQLEVQISTTAAVSTASKNGVAHFNSANFTVDANGFVSAIGGGGSGTIIQQVRTSTAAFSTTTANIPYDNTIPQQTEGTQLFTLSITPTSATNILYFQFSGLAGGSDSNLFGTFALFQDANADAIYATTNRFEDPSDITDYSFTFYMVAGTTAATTFKIRYGHNNFAPQVMSINGANKGGLEQRIFGGVANTNLTITEIVP